jgi:sugar phosphate permease
MAGLLNGFCYVGSTVTSYGLGAIADRFGWAAVFYVLLGAATLAALIGILYLLFCKNRITE